MLNDPAALIMRKESWPGYILLRLKSPRVARLSRPGQFLMVRVCGQPYPLLRRPLSIHARDGDCLELFFARAGLGTGILADKKTGETLDILGPLGKGFRAGKTAGKAFWLVGGGRGIAPLYFLAGELLAKEGRPRLFYGGRSEADLPLLRKFAALKMEKVFISTDDGSAGFPGRVTDMLEKELARGARPAMMFACGPDPMLERVGEIAAANRVPAALSLESIMGCGIGACWGCVHRIRTAEGEEWVKICEEGPVFPAGKVIWARDRGNKETPPGSRAGIGKAGRQNE